MAEPIAFLGWGSLLWTGSFASPAEAQRQRAFDRQRGPWHDGGPVLKLEFSRVSVSRCGALTLVIDAENGASVPVAWCFSRRASAVEAVEDLRRRERTVARHIGLFTAAGERSFRDADAFDAISRWAQSQAASAVVWSDLPSNFHTVIGQPFSVAAACAYLRSLPADGTARALEYIRRAPSFVRTPLRDHLQRVTLVA